MLNQTSPSTLIEAWVLVPALVIAASAALGWLLARLTDTQLGPLTVPAGFLTGVALASALLSLGLSGKLSVALVAVLVVAGALGAARELRRAGRLPRIGAPFVWPAATVAVAYAIALAPVVGSGHSAVLGYQMNGDSAFHVTLVEEIARHGAHADHPMLDSVHATTRDLEAGYPLGSYAWPLFARVLTGIGVFHIWTPLSAVVLALMALVAYSILRTLAMPRGFAAAAGVLAGAGYLMYSYHAQGGTKEVLMPLAVYGAVALAARALEGEATPRSLIPAGVAGAAVIANLGFGGLAWAAPAGVALALVLGIRARRSGSWASLQALAAAAGLAVVLALPSVLRTLSFFNAAKSTISEGFGNLFGGVPFREAFNVWLAHDYRHAIPDAVGFTDVGVWVATAFCVIGGVWALWRRNVAVPLMLLAAIGAVAIITPGSAIYFDAKTYVAAAPAMGVATAVGVLALARRGGALRIAGIAVGALLALGAVASDAYVYSGVWVTPRYRFEELARIAQVTRGQGPMLVNDGEEFAAYILRDSRPWTEHALRSPGGEYSHPLNQRPVRPLDPDDYAPRHIEGFPLVLERKTPYGSRPPGNYADVLETKRYRLWRREGPAPVFHLPLGGDNYVGSELFRCFRGQPYSLPARFLIHSARTTGALLRAAVAPPDPVVAIDPHSWVNFHPVALFKPAAFVAMTGGSASGLVTLPPGRYEVWIAGSMGPGVAVWERPLDQIRSIRIGYAANDMGLPALWQPIAVADMPHRAIVHVSWVNRSWWKASSQHPNTIGPLVFTPAGARDRLVELPAARATSLCGKRLDWLELVGGGRRG